MGKVISGIALGFSGKVGNMIFSQQPDGTVTVREAPNPEQLPPPTEQQLRAQMDTALASNITGAMKGFLDVSYSIQSKLDKMNQNNSCASFIKLNLLLGEYPNRSVDMSRLLVSRGQMRAPEEATVTVNETGLSFTWNPETKDPGEHYSDQIMVIAYFPALKISKYKISGAQRYSGQDILRLDGAKKGNTAVVYIAFISDDHKKMSDSVYLGEINW